MPYSVTLLSFRRRGVIAGYFAITADFILVCLLLHASLLLVDLQFSTRSLHATLDELLN